MNPLGKRAKDDYVPFDLNDPSLLDGIYGDMVWNDANITTSTIGNHQPGANYWVSRGAVHYGDGMVVTGPNDITNFIVSDTKDSTYSMIASGLIGRIPSEGVVYCGNNKVLAIPCFNPQFVLVDMITHTVERFAIGSASTTGNNSGGVYLGNGMALAISHNAPFVLVNTTNKTATYIGSSQGANAFYGGVYIGDGLVLAIPFGRKEFAIVDTVNLSISYFGTAIADAYRCGVYIGDGKVLAIPANATQFAIVDPYNKTVDSFGPTFAGTHKWHGGVYIGNGKVIAIPCNASQMAIVDTINRTAENVGPNLGAGTYKYIGGAFAGNGKILAARGLNAGGHLLIDLGAGYRTNNQISEQAMLSAWLNKY